MTQDDHRLHELVIDAVAAVGAHVGVDLIDEGTEALGRDFVRVEREELFGVVLEGVDDLVRATVEAREVNGALDELAGVIEVLVVRDFAVVAP